MDLSATERVRAPEEHDGHEQGIGNNAQMWDLPLPATHTEKTGNHGQIHVAVAEKIRYPVPRPYSGIVYGQPLSEEFWPEL